MASYAQLINTLTLTLLLHFVYKITGFVYYKQYMRITYFSTRIIKTIKAYNLRDSIIDIYVTYEKQRLVLYSKYCKH